VRVFVDQLACTGSGLCELAVPEVFQLGDDGLATVLDGDRALPNGGADEGGVEVPEDLAAAVRDAAAVCPGACIYCREE
jgi:ferredoxin